jgi:signal transduction histidine kinase
MQTLVLANERRHAGSLGKMIPIIQPDRTEEGSNRALAQALRATRLLRRHNCQLALLNRASQAFCATLDMDRLLITVLEAVRRLLDVSASSVWLTNPETGELVCWHATGPCSQIVRGQRLPPGEGIAGWVARSGESLMVPNVQADEWQFTGMDQRDDVTLRSILSVPLRARGRVIGVLQAADPEVGRLNPTDLALLESLADSAATAIANAWLVRMLHRRVRDLEAQNGELDAFNHTVAHDLKNPLARVIGYAEILEGNCATMPDEDLRQYLHAIVRNGRKMNSIIDGLLLLAEAHNIEVELEPLDMQGIVAEALQRLAPMIEEYQAEITLPDTWPAAMGYGPWVEEVWANYISNGIKYGGRPPQVQLGATARADGTVCFWVRDNGQGISPEDQRRLFVPFTRLDPASVEGHGLGLSIVQRIVKKLGGEVGVESRVGRGSVFAFTLPGVQAGGSAGPSPPGRD